MEGFFGRLRQGVFDTREVDALEELLNRVDVDDQTEMPRRFVSMTWWIPTFMEWQVERVQERGGDVEQLKRDVVRLRNVLDRVLGVP